MCRQCSQTYGQRGFSRTGMNDLPLTISLQLVSPDTPTCHVSTKSFITLKTIIRLISPFLPRHFPASWLSGQNAVVLSTLTLGMLTELWEALWSPGYFFLPGTATGTYSLSSLLLLTVLTSSSHATRDLTISLLGSQQQGLVFYAPFD